MQTYWPNLWSDRTTGVNVVRGESIRLSADWKAAGTVVSSSWQSREITTELSDPNLVGTVTDVLVKATGIGVEIIDNLVVLSTGETRAQRFEVEIVGGERLDISCPLMTSPGDGATLLTPTTVLLAWTLGEGVTEYGVYLWADGDDRPTTPTYTVTGSTYTVTGLDAETLYNWAITAIYGGAESLGCGEFTFTTAIPIPLCPVLVSPVDGFETDEDELTFTWLASEGATSYNLYVTIEVEAEQLLTSTASLSYDATGLTLGVDYTWRVTAVNATGESSGCGSRSFTTTNTVLLSAAAYSAFDTEGFATIIILRNGTIGAVTADYATADDTAVSPGNYTDTNGTVIWPDGDAESRPVQIPIQPLELVEEWESDKLYPWIDGTNDPRNGLNGYQYKLVHSSSVWRDTLAAAQADSVTFYGETLEDTLIGWTKGDTEFENQTISPYFGVASDESYLLQLHYNQYTSLATRFETTLESELTGIGSVCLVFPDIGIQPGSARFYWTGRYSDGGIGTTFAGVFQFSIRYTGDIFDPPLLSGYDSVNNCTNLPPPPGDTFPTWFAYADTQISARRVPSAPPIPGSDLPDWPIDPTRFWWDEETGQIYSKEPWVRVDGAYRWLSLYSLNTLEDEIDRYPIGPVLPVGHPDDTEEFWQAARDAAVLAGTLPAEALTYQANGLGDDTTFPRNSAYAWYRDYKLPLQFTVNLSNPVGAELVEPDSATVYILPA